MISASNGVFIPGGVGIGTDAANNALTVNGIISSNNVVYAIDGNSNLWNTAYNISTTYSSTSGSFATNTALNATSSVLLPTSIYRDTSGN